MTNNAGTARFLMLTLAFTATFMHLFGVELLQWQLSHSSLYAYVLALGVTSLSGVEGINPACYVVTCLAIGAFFAWLFGIFLSYCECALHKSRESQCVKTGHRGHIYAACRKEDDQ